MKHLRWPIAGFANIARIRETDGAIGNVGDTRYPLRCFRYWFAAQALAALHRRLGRPLAVLEVGIDKGQMLAFLGGPELAPGRYVFPPSIAAWDGMDIQADPAVLTRYGYSSYFERNVEEPIRLGERRYDAIVLLHILEHLHDPEAAVARLTPHLAPGGSLIGGSPTLPQFLALRHERRLRRKVAGKMHDVRLHKHLSVLSPWRVRKMAREEGLTPEVVTGAFVARNSGRAIENSRAWFRANMIWGALVPPLGAEVYFVLSVPAASF